MSWFVIPLKNFCSLLETDKRTNTLTTNISGVQHKDEIRDHEESVPAPYIKPLLFSVCLGRFADTNGGGGEASFALITIIVSFCECTSSSPRCNPAGLVRRAYFVNWVHTGRIPVAFNHGGFRHLRGRESLVLELYAHSVCNWCARVTLYWHACAGHKYFVYNCDGFSCAIGGGTAGTYDHTKGKHTDYAAIIFQRIALKNA